ncbi:MAG: cupredoxin domain-containing protein [Chloroflexi bacterium]|nr:cupredoxin domain-containing protein [Chloroflexota bacterium]
MRAPALALAFAFVLVVTACSGGGSSSSPSGAAPSSPAAGSASAGAHRIEVKLTDALKMEPGEMAVKAGQPVTFVVTNSGANEHEFYLGDAAAQDKHESEMASMVGMMHDEPEGIAVKPGETKELTYTFAAAGAFLAGCHVTGHYGGGMKASITVT